MEKKVVDRRLFIKGLFGVAGAGALAVMLPRPAEALMGLPPNDPASGSNAFPELDKFADSSEEGAETVLDEGVELASHRRRRRRRRRRRWRRYCRREWWNGYYHRRCRRRRVWIWLSI